MKAILASVALWSWAAAVSAQDARPLAVGDAAPDFVLTGATAKGVLEAPIRLSDFRDQTLVIAFFYKARTKG
jgi:peroxiredoxin